MKIIDAMKQLGITPVDNDGFDQHVPEGVFFDEYKNAYDVKMVVGVFVKMAEAVKPKKKVTKKKH